MTDKFITKEGLKKLKLELDELKNIKRPKLAIRIKEAKELGDLSENADYQSAKEDQGFMEGRISQLEDLVKNAVVVGKKSGGDSVSIGSEVEIKNGGKTHKYTITGSNESDPLNGKISNESPMGQAIMDKRVGDKFITKTPRGEVEYTILRIS